MIAPARSVRPIFFDGDHSFSAHYYTSHHHHHQDVSNHPQEQLVKMRLNLKRTFHIRCEGNNNTAVVMEPPPAEATFYLSVSGVDYSFDMTRLESQFRRIVSLFHALPFGGRGRVVAHRHFYSFLYEEVRSALQRGVTLLRVLAVMNYDVYIPEITPAVRRRYDEEWTMAERVGVSIREAWEREIALGESARMVQGMAAAASREFIESQLDKCVWGVGIADDGDDEQDSCSVEQYCVVCMEKFVYKQSEVARMPCKHIFHETCITKWLEVSSSCPLCRAQAPQAAP